MEEWKPPAGKAGNNTGHQPLRKPRRSIWAWENLKDSLPFIVLGAAAFVGSFIIFSSHMHFGSRIYPFWELLVLIGAASSLTGGLSLIAVDDTDQAIVALNDAGFVQVPRDEWIELCLIAGKPVGPFSEGVLRKLAASTASGKLPVTARTTTVPSGLPSAMAIAPASSAPPTAAPRSSSFGLPSAAPISTADLHPSSHLEDQLPHAPLRFDPAVEEALRDLARSTGEAIPPGGGAAPAGAGMLDIVEALRRADPLHEGHPDLVFPSEPPPASYLEESLPPTAPSVDPGVEQALRALASATGGMTNGVSGSVASAGPEQALRDLETTLEGHLGPATPSESPRAEPVGLPDSPAEIIQRLDNLGKDAESPLPPEPTPSLVSPTVHLPTSGLGAERLEPSPSEDVSPEELNSIVAEVEALFPEPKPTGSVPVAAVPELATPAAEVPAPSEPAVELAPKTAEPQPSPPPSPSTPDAHDLLSQTALDEMARSLGEMAAASTPAMAKPLPAPPAPPRPTERLVPPEKAIPTPAPSEAPSEGVPAKVDAPRSIDDLARELDSMRSTLFERVVPKAAPTPPTELTAPAEVAPVPAEVVALPPSEEAPPVPGSEEPGSEAVPSEPVAPEAGTHAPPPPPTPPTPEPSKSGADLDGLARELEAMKSTLLSPPRPAKRGLPPPPPKPGAGPGPVGPAASLQEAQKLLSSPPAPSVAPPAQLEEDDLQKELEQAEETARELERRHVSTKDTAPSRKKKKGP